ncbi:MAG: hypothetical protein AAFU65_05440, partial [Pseudomonadota bacterium]
MTFRALTTVLFASLLCSAVPARAEVNVLWGNCEDALAGGCVAADSGQITLWLRGEPGQRLALRDQRGALDVLRSSAVDGGQRYDVTLRPRSTRINVVDTASGDAPLWSLPITREPGAPKLERVKSLFGAREYDACEALLTTLVDDPSYTRRGSAERLAGIFYYSRGQPEKARQFYGRAIRSLTAEGRSLEAVRAASALAYLEQHTLRDFGRARAALAAMPITDNASAEARYWAAYDRGLLALNTGHPRDALTAFDDASRIARRLGDAGRWLQRRLDAEELLAAQLQRIGRRRDAQRVLGDWRQRDLSSLAACERAQFGSNAAWSTLLALEAGEAGDSP